MAGAMEVIVVHAPKAVPPDTCGAFRARFPAGFRVQVTDATIPQMRRVGVAACRGDIVALIEDDCIVDDRWAPAIVEAHEEGPHVAVGGAVEPGGYRHMRDWAAYLSDYSRFMLPLPDGDAAVLPGNNVSYKRHVVDELLDMTAADGLQETFVHNQWRTEGKPLRADVRVVVRNEHRWGTRDLVAVPFLHARAFGGRRARGWSIQRRVMFAGGSAALPILHVWRVLDRVRRRHRRSVPILRAWPWVALYGVSWAAGECLGYLAGAGDSSRRWR
jgi:hypothetical protein